MTFNSIQSAETNIRNMLIFRYRFLNHAAFWLFIVGFFSSHSIIRGDPPVKVLVYNTIFLPMDMAAVYLTIYVLIPRFLLQYRWIPFFVYLHIIIILMIILNYGYKTALMPAEWILDESEMNFFSHAYYTFWIVYMEIGLASMIKLFKHWYVISVRKAELEKSNFLSELTLLRSQINPHFLFNTLNNIYSLVLKKDPMAPEAVMKLSEMLRYTLNDTGTDLVDLKNELHYINSYIALQKLRLEDPSFVDYRIEGETGQRKIAPMLLIPVIENAFKHGLRKTASPGIVIRIGIGSREVVLSAINVINTIHPPERTSGIGLQNLRRRLALLYPDRHELTIRQDDKDYQVQLKLVDP